MTLDLPPLSSSRVLLERVLVSLTLRHRGTPEEAEADAAAEAIRTELGARPWQGVNPYGGAG
jgi:hypothetical protein